MSESDRRTFEFIELMKNNTTKSGDIRPHPEDVIVIDGDYDCLDDVMI